VRVYLRTETRKETVRGTGFVGVNKVWTKYWFGENSDFYRSDYQSTKSAGKQVIYTNIIVEKEFDATISITAPEM
jgi:hypothetical protein